MSLYVGNLSSHVQRRELENAFRRFGRSNLELKDGYGFVVYEEYREAERALKALQGRLVCGERLSISWARSHRPFQRFSGKGNSFRRGSWDKDQGQVSKKRPPLESDKGSGEDRKEYQGQEEVKGGSRASETREDAAEISAREEDWKDQGTEKLAFEEEVKDSDPLDNGRWGLSEGSPERIVGDGMGEYEEDLLDDREKLDIDGSMHEKSHGSPVDRSLDRPSRTFRNSDDQYKRGRDSVGKPQERCFNCGHLGHVMRQCRARMRMNMYPRDGFDGRRNQFRNLRGVGFRGTGGRFRVMEGSRRFFNRDMEGSYGRRNLRRQSSKSDRRMHDQVDSRSRDKSRHRHRRSESRQDSLTRERTKKKHKRSSKKSSRSTKKRRRSSSDSPSASQSRSRSPLSSPSRPLSRSRSRSLASRSQSSKSRSRSSSSASRSGKSQSASSRSRSVSASSRSRSRSQSSCSGKSPTKSRSRSVSGSSRSRSRSRSSRSGMSPNKSKGEANGMSDREEKQDAKIVDDAEMQEKDCSKYSSAAAESFGAARLWPWETILYRRLKRGPITTANYERRKLQNEEFGIEDKFVRSSSGWWEKYPE